DVPEAEARREIAEDLLRRERGKGLAKRAAENAIAELRSGLPIDALDQKLRASSPHPAGGKDDRASEGEQDPLAPRVEETTSFRKGENPFYDMSNPGPLFVEAFKLTKEAPIPTNPLELQGDFLVVRLEEREHPKREEFDEAVQ